jgi:hypothetical protein
MNLQIMGSMARRVRHRLLPSLPNQYHQPVDRKIHHGIIHTLKTKQVLEKEGV